VGIQVPVGVVLGWVWLVVSPRPAARWAATFWYAESATDFSAVQDVFFALLTVVPGLVVGGLLAWWSGRAHPARRVISWLAGAVGGAVACWLTGAGFGAGLAAPPAIGTAVAAAPVTLTSYGLLVLWPFAAAIVMTLTLAIRGAFGRTW
jgi:hypothetical protein